MGFYWICLLAVIGVTFGDDGCPPPAEISPCTCDNEGVNCMEAKSLDDIKKAFRANFKYGAARYVWVQDTPITSLPANLFGKIKIVNCDIEINQIATVDLNALRASRSTLNNLSLFGNKIKDFPFAALKKFEVLSSLNLGKNLIQSVPDDAFQSQTLWEIILQGNEIRHIGENAFALLPKLLKLDISNNKLAVLGPLSFASSGHYSGLQIDVSYNRLTDVDSTAFKGATPFVVNLSKNKFKTLKRANFEPLVESLVEKGTIDVSGNPLTCQGCDFSWFITNKDTLVNIFKRFACKDGTSLYDLTKTKIGC